MHCLGDQGLKEVQCLGDQGQKEVEIISFIC